MHSSNAAKIRTFSGGSRLPFKAHLFHPLDGQRSLAADLDSVAGGLAFLEKVGNMCQMKFWLWEYDLHVEVNVNGQVIKSQANADFHVVSGRSSCTDGADQANVYSKNGQRPIIGPDFGGSFKPPLREQRQQNDAAAKLMFFDPVTGGQTTTNTGFPIMGIRNNMKESCHCLDVTNTDGR